MANYVFEITVEKMLKIGGIGSVFLLRTIRDNTVAKKAKKKIFWTKFFCENLLGEKVMMTPQISHTSTPKYKSSDKDEFHRTTKCARTRSLYA